MPVKSNEEKVQEYILKKTIDLSDNCSFSDPAYALNCFGYNCQPTGMRKGAKDHPFERGKEIWFPQMENTENNGWVNVRCSLRCSP